MIKNYRVEYFDIKQNNWIILSYHKNESSAVINAEVKSKSRKVKARVIFEGKIIYEIGG